MPQTPTQTPAPRHPLASNNRSDWWKSAVVYQIYPRSFQDSDGDGIGDIRGILQRVDHLAALGVDVVWLSPVYRSPMADNGYDISDYRDIDPLFGTLADLDELIAALHARGIRLMMDLVVNHTSDEHPWFVESRSSVDSPKRDWYWWRSPRDGGRAGEPGAEPNGWRSFFSGPAWTLDESTGEYYLHLFDPKQPDLNWTNPEVRHAVYDMMRWWLDRGVDGFRMDVINLISKDAAFVDSGGEGFGGGAGYTDWDRLHLLLQEMHREVFEGRTDLEGGSIITVGETPGVTIEEAVRMSDPARRELDMVFQFEHVGLDHGAHKFDVVPLAPGALADSLSRWQQGLADRGWNSVYLENHDQPRSVSRFGNDREHWYASATALATVQHLLRGTPYVYQGQELGMTNSTFVTIDEYRDIESLNAYAAQLSLGTAAEDALAGISMMSRDHARTPMQWDASERAGFTAGQPWLPANGNHDRINAAAQVGVAGSVFEYVRQLIELRHSMPVIAHGSFARIDAGDPAVFAFERELGDDGLLVIVNLSSDAVEPKLSDEVVERWRVSVALLGNQADPAHSGELGSVIAEADGAPSTFDALLAPWEARVYATPAQ